MSTETQDVQAENAEEVVHPQDQQLSDNLSSQDSQASEQPEPNSKEYNFRQLEKSRDELQQKVAELEKKVQQSSEPQQKAPSPEEDYNLSPDDLVEGKHLKKEINRLEQQLQSYQAMSIETRLRSSYQDFDAVVNKENIEKLKQTEPELASSLLSGSDLYSKGVAAYKLLKQMGYGSDGYQADKERVQQNAAKPRSVSQAGGQQGPSPIHQANRFQRGLTPELQAQLRKEMEEATQGY